MDKKYRDSLTWFMSNYRVVAAHHRDYTDGCTICYEHIHNIYELLRLEAENNARMDKLGES